MVDQVPTLVPTHQTHQPDGAVMDNKMQERLHTIGQAVSQRREAFGWPRSELARRAGVHMNTVKDAEMGKFLTRYVGERISKALGMPIDVKFLGKGRRAPGAKAAVAPSTDELRRVVSGTPATAPTTAPVETKHPAQERPGQPVQVRQRPAASAAHGPSTVRRLPSEPNAAPAPEAAPKVAVPSPQRAAFSPGTEAYRVLCLLAAGHMPVDMAANELHSLKMSGKL